MNEPLDQSFYARDPVTVARELLGMRLVRAVGDDVTIGKIVEVEAYLAQDDPASHAFRGPTRRNAAMFGPPGCAYVYSIHARCCVNAVTQPEGVPSAVLIRAVEPLAGVQIMEQRRPSNQRNNLTRGPARLCEAFAIDRSLDRWDLTVGEQMWITMGEPPEFDTVASSTRIGVTSAKDLCLRFFLSSNRFVSR